MIDTCEGCKSKKRRHQYQDKVYGLYRRVMNRTVKKSPSGFFIFRCTVCSHEQ